MTERILIILTVLAGALYVPSAAATDAIVKHRATLRKDPSTHHAPILTLTASEDVALIEPAQTAGYYHVRTADGDEGWVSARSVELLDAQSGSTAPSPHPPSGGQPTSQPVSTTGVASSLSTSWDKPAPNQTTFHGPDGDCGPTGDGGDTFTNARKNRTDEPAQYHDVSWKAVQGLAYPVAGRSLATWSTQQLAEIQPYEGEAVSVVGYLAAIKVEAGGSGESTNCHFSNAVEVDWHMPLVEHSGDPEATAIVVETTPRVRQMHAKWTSTALSPWVNSADPVRISGWTLLDPEHRAHLGKYRSTLWEIHPITKIEVFQDGQWVNADDLP
jgi:hypothetical protein